MKILPFLNIFYLCFVISLNYSIMANRTGHLLVKFRELLKMKYLGDTIQGYIVLSEDAHQVIKNYVFIYLKF